MNKKRGYQWMIGLLSLLQLLFGIGMLVLDRLSHRKVGINHHVVFKKHEYMKSILNGSHVHIYKIIILAILLFLICYLVYSIRRKSNVRIILSGFMMLLFGAILYIELAWDSIVSLPIYIYLLLATSIIWLLELGKTMLQILLNRNE